MKRMRDCFVQRLDQGNRETHGMQSMWSCGVSCRSSVRIDPQTLQVVLANRDVAPSREKSLHPAKDGPYV